MPSVPSRGRALVLVVLAAAGLAACAEQPHQTAVTGCHAEPGVLDFRVGGRGTMLPPPRHHECGPNSGPIASRPPHAG